MIKTKEPVIEVTTMTDTEGVTRVQHVETANRMVYTYPDKIEVNHMGGRKQVYRNAAGQVVSVHAWRRGRATTMAELMAKITGGLTTVANQSI